MRPSAKSIIKALQDDDHPKSGWMKSANTRDVDPARTELYIEVPWCPMDPAEFHNLWLNLSGWRVYASGWSGHGFRFYGHYLNPFDNWRIRRAVKAWSTRRGFDA